VSVTVAIPVRDGGARLREVLEAVRGQIVDRPVELLVIDTASRDGSAEAARAAGARVIAIAPHEFSHGGTRNRLMELAGGDHVAFLTQDAVPADERWLERLLAGFALADDVALAFGPYLPAAGASVPVRRELTEWFAGMPPGVVRGEVPLGPASFFSSANGAVARRAWERVPFRPVPYAEDQRLALDMLAAGYAKAYVPEAGVVHSHEYGAVDQFRRTFDEFRALREVYGHRAPLRPRAVAGRVRREVAADRAFGGGSWESLRYHSVRALGGALGSRADRLPAAVRRACSLERRATFEPSCD
jgi:glycosyltransferase involved in cell wall biosynthesis